MGCLDLRSDDLVLHHFGELCIVVRIPGVDLVEKTEGSVAATSENLNHTERHLWTDNEEKIHRQKITAPIEMLICTDLVEKAAGLVAADVDDPPERRHHFAVLRRRKDELPTAGLMDGSAEKRVTILR